MASLSDILAIVKQIHDELPDLIARSKLAPKQIAVVSGLSDISERLGLVQAGEFRSGNSVEPGKGFTGVRMGYPAFLYNSLLWNIAGLNNDTLQFGANASDGTLWAGGGSIRMTSGGILIYDGSTQTGAIESDGDIKFGSNLAAAGTTSLIVFANSQTYNGEAVGAGDVLIGDNSSGKPNILWDASASELLFRLGTIVTNKMSSTAVANMASRISSSGNQALTTGGAKNIVQFNTVDYDDASFATTGANAKLTVPAGMGGRYEVGYYFSLFSYTPPIVISSYMAKNGSTAIMGDGNAGGTTYQASGDVLLAAGEYVELQVYTTNAASLSSTDRCFMYIRRIR